MSEAPKSTKTHLVVPVATAQSIVDYLQKLAAQKQQEHREVVALIRAVMDCNPKPEPDPIEE
jgi:hypothetical protein